MAAPTAPAGGEPAKAREALLAERERLDMLWKIASSPDTDTNAIADHVLESMVALTQSEYGFYGSLDADRSTLVLHSWSSDAMSGCSVDEGHQRLFPVEGAGLWA